jgi:Carbohydrate binding module (family 35)
LTLNGMTVPGAGTYQLTIVYIAGDGPRSANLSVNGGTPQSITFGRTSNWSTVGSLSIGITLQAGTNTLQFGNPTSWAPDLDKITVR